MSKSLFGDQFDLHGGGKDLIFPHHENEMAQTEAVTNKPMVSIWMHAGFVQMDQIKMSKSLGNFLTIRDALKSCRPEVLRYFCISSHYRSPVMYSADALKQSHSALERLYTALRDLPDAPRLENTDFEKRFIAAMNDDFNTPVAFSVFFELAHEVHRLRSSDLERAAQHGALLKYLGNALGMLEDKPDDFLQGALDSVTINKINALIEMRLAARAQKHWAQSDAIRDELAAMSIVIEDTATGTQWKMQ